MSKAFWLGPGKIESFGKKLAGAISGFDWNWKKLWLLLAWALLGCPNVVDFWDCWKSGSGFTPDIVSRGLDWKALLLSSVERLNLLMKLLKAVVKLGSVIWEGR